LNVQLPDRIKLLEGNFVERCKDLSAKSVDLIFTDPPYNVESLPLYTDLAKIASLLLKDGASLVTYCGQNLKYQVIQIMESNGLTHWWEIALIQTGSSARMFTKNVIVTWKPLLWFVKGAKLRTSEFIKDSVESQYPDKTLHNWTQSIVEAKHIISKLTYENDVVLDPMMGVATTGVASLNLNRQFIGIEKDAETFKIAKARLGSISLAGVTTGTNFLAA
jgi:16S rRNA G966 N2-methylase RsmD